MTRVYEEREMWAKPYFQKISCAGMCSTQRSECANHMLKIYTVCKSSINAFVTQYTKLIDDRESCHAMAEKNSKQAILFNYLIKNSKLYGALPVLMYNVIALTILFFL